MMQIRHACISTQLRAIGSISRADRDGRLYLLVGDTVVHAAQYLHCVSPAVSASKMHPHKLQELRLRHSLYSSVDVTERSNVVVVLDLVQNTEVTQDYSTPLLIGLDIDRSVPTGGGVGHSRSLLAISGGSTRLAHPHTTATSSSHLFSTLFCRRMLWFPSRRCNPPFLDKGQGGLDFQRPYASAKPPFHVTGPVQLPAQFTSRPNVLHFVPNIPFGTVLCTKCNKFWYNFEYAVATPTRRTSV